MALTKGTHHIALRAADSAQFDRLIRFYRETLGMAFVRSWGEGAGRGMMLDTGDGTVMELFASGGDDTGTGAVRHFALATDDVDACCAAAEAEGYEVFTKPTDIVIGAETPFPARIAFVRGPVGEEIEFFCEK